MRVSDAGSSPSPRSLDRKDLHGKYAAGRRSGVMFTREIDAQGAIRARVREMFDAGGESEPTMANASLGQDKTTIRELLTIPSGGR